MPTREDIDRFKNIINQWGDEPAVLAARGEKIEDVRPPEQSLEESLGMEQFEGDDISLDELLEQAGGDEEAPESEDHAGESVLPEESPGLDDLGGTEDLGGLDDLGGIEDLGGLDDLAGTEDLGGGDDLGGTEDLGGLDDLAGAEDLGGLDDLGGTEDLGGLDDLGGTEDLGGLDDLGGIEDLGGLDDLEGAEDLGGLDDMGLPGLDEIPELGQNIEEPRDVDLDDLDGPADETEIGNEIDLTSPSEDIPELGGMDDFSTDGDSEETMQFSLGDFGEEFNFQEGINFDEDMDASLDSLDTLDDTFLMEDQEDLEDEEEDAFDISEKDMGALQDTLRRLPLNLKLAIQDEFAEADLTSERYQKLIELLIKGVPPRQISGEFFNITGKKIEIPRGYQKHSGRAFERKRTGFIYQFQEKGWPLLRLFTLILVALGLLVALSFQFLYRPLQAMVYYNNGLEKIKEFEFDVAEESFRKAYFGWSLGRIINIKGWPSKGRFLEYAEAYIAQRDYIHGEAMYRGLIGEYRNYLEGYLEYGQFLTNVLGDYAKSTEILSMGLDRDLYNYKLMLALGDNYMLWAEEDPSKLEDARYQYAAVLSRYRNRDEVALRMLRYFIAKKDDQNIRMWGNIFQSKSSIKGDPSFSSQTLSMLGGYFIDTNNVSDAKDFLFRAEALDDTVPEVHYQLSRYFNKTYNLNQEKSALQKALYYLEQKPLLSANQIFMKIGIHKRRGELHFSEGNYDLAENEYTVGIRLLENSQIRGLIGTRPEVGELYADMGNLHYDIHDDLKGALEYFILAEKNQFSNGDISYKKGYIYYDQQEYDQAVLEFEDSLDHMASKRSSRYALANTMVKRQNLFGARNLYNELLRDLKLEESNLPFLVPEDIVEHRSLVNYFVLVYNNLGYVEYQLSQRRREPERQSQALVYLAKAGDYADRLDRDPETGIRSRPEDNQVFLNTMALLRPLPETDIYMLDDIPRSPDKLLVSY